MQHIVNGKTLVGLFVGGVATGITLAASGVCWLGYKYAEYKVKQEEKKETDAAEEGLRIEPVEET